MGVYLNPDELARRQQTRGTYVPTDLQPTELASLAGRRHQIGLDYGAQKAGTDYEIGEALRNYQRAQQQYSSFDRPALQQQLRLGREKLPANFAERNILNSGIYKKALSEYKADSTRQLGAQEYGFQQDQAARHRQGQQLLGKRYAQNAAFYAAMSQVNLEEQARRAELAQQIRGLV